MEASDKPLYWVGGSLDDLRAFPLEVQRVMGFALRQAQGGEKHVSAKPLGGFDGAGVLARLWPFGTTAQPGCCLGKQMSAEDLCMSARIPDMHKSQRFPQRHRRVGGTPRIPRPTCRMAKGQSRAKWQEGAMGRAPDAARMPTAPEVVAQVTCSEWGVWHTAVLHLPAFQYRPSHPTARQGRYASSTTIRPHGLTLDPLTLSTSKTL